MLKRSFIKNEITSCLNTFLWTKNWPGKKAALLWLTTVFRQIGFNDDFHMVEMTLLQVVALPICAKSQKVAKMVTCCNFQLWAKKAKKVIFCHTSRKNSCK